MKVCSQDTPARIACNVSVDSLNAQLAKFWEIKEIASVKHHSNSEKACEFRFTQTDINGRYIVRLPFNEKRHNLGESYQIALKRLYSLERRLMRDPQVYQEYSSFLKEYEDLGHMTEISNHNVVEVGYFIPHHPVFKRDSHTTKIRVVFDASSKTTRYIIK